TPAPPQTSPTSPFARASAAAFSPAASPPTSHSATPTPTSSDPPESPPPFYTDPAPNPPLICHSHDNRSKTSPGSAESPSKSLLLRPDNRPEDNLPNERDKITHSTNPDASS